jgi:hypothetical protein
MVAAAMTVGTVAANAQPAPADDPAAAPAITQRIGVWRIDALGIEPELVARLETLFRMELDRLSAKPMPARREIDRVIGGELRDCTGEDKCLAAIGRKINVDVMVSGSVGALGDNYILNIKAVDVAGAKQIRKIQSDPLRGSPDELIEGIRVAAYKLLAPEQLHGSIAILSDLVGATVTLDGKDVGKTPLPGPITRQPLGEHVLRVEAKGFDPFEDKVVIRFQKSTRVVVRLVTKVDPNSGTVVVRPRDPWYSRWYVVAAIGVVAIGAGVMIGRELAVADPETSARVQAAIPPGVGP